MNKFYSGDTFICGSNSNGSLVSIIGPTVPELQLIESINGSEVTPTYATSPNTMTVAGLNFTTLNLQRIAIMPPQSLFYATFHSAIGLSVSTAQALTGWTAVVTTTDLGPNSSTGQVAIHTAGYYRIYAKVWFQSSAATSRNILIYADATALNYRNSSSSTNQATCEIDFIYHETATNDYLSLYASSNGVATTITDYVFSIERLY